MCLTPLRFSACYAEVAAWSEPSIDAWSYANGFNAGSRVLAPSFAGIALEEDRFETNSQFAPARLGSMLIAFETSGDIPPGLAPARYAINAVTMTAQLQGPAEGLTFSKQPITPEGLLAAALGQGITSEIPMELFGVGFRSGYQGFALGPDQSGVRLSESTPIYGADGYVAYPVVGDGHGGLLDVSNNITGGFSATSPTGVTDPFTAAPWSIGLAEGLTQGAPIAHDSTFTFDVDLSQPGVVDHLQQALSDGSVGFFLSSMHPTAQPGEGGGVAYPQWYAKEFGGMSSAATLAIEFEVLSSFPPGDYNHDGRVDTLDYQRWREQYGSAAPEADGNQDGRVDAADYAFWRNAVSQTTLPVAVVVPDPNALQYAGLFGFTLLFCWGSHRLVAPRD